MSLVSPVFAQSTAQADSIAETRTAIMKLENSEQTLYELYSSTFALWVSKKDEAKVLQDQVNLLVVNDSLSKENVRILTSQLADKTKEAAALSERLNEMEKKMKRRKVAGRVVAFVSFGLGVYLGARFL